MLSSYDDAYERIRTTPGIRRLEIGEFLFAEFKCVATDQMLGAWAHTDLLVHVVGGKKTYRTHAGRWLAEAGQTVFLKKGAYILEQHVSEESCVYLFFIPDRFIRGTVRELAAELPADTASAECSDPILPVENDAAISAFLSAIAVYFDADEAPAPALLKLKVKELVTGIPIGPGNRRLSAYFRAVASSEGVAISEIMESNFCQNLTMGEFARLCHRSLSTFKREFRSRVELRQGELEELPHEGEVFDLVTGFNSFQYANDPVRALAEARRVVRPGGQVVMATWGRPEDCDAAGHVEALGALLPPAPPGAGGPFALSDEKVLRDVVTKAGLTVTEVGDIACAWEYPSEAVALRGMLSAGPVVLAIKTSGEERVRAAVLQAIAPYRTEVDGYRLENKFRYVSAQR